MLDTTLPHRPPHRNHCDRPAPPRRAALRLVAVLLALLLVGGLTACESTERSRVQVLDLVNRSRAADGLPTPRRNVQLEVKADAWARRLRDRCRLSHSVLAAGAPDNWNKLGENVGFAGSIGEVHRAFLGSPGHRANILDRAFTHVGSAAVWGTCQGQRRVFVVTVYMQEM